MSEINVPENICKNCNHTFTKQFCNVCGQKNVSRITNAHLVHEVIHAVLHADKGIFPYIYRLVSTPGVMAREYINGKRKVFNPIQFLILSIGFLVLLMTLTHFYESVEALQPKNTLVNRPEVQQLLAFNELIAKNGNIIVFMLIPIFAFFGNLLFAKQKNNYAEHFMLAIFTISLSNVLTSVLLPSYYLIGIGITATIISTLFITLFSFCIIFKQFYQIHWFQALWRGIAVYALSMIIYMIVIAIVMVGIVVVSLVSR